MEDADFDPNKLAHPASGYRFQPRVSFQSDLATTELRLVILGWLRQAEQIINSNGGLQELRDAVFRAGDLTVALSARHLTLTHTQRAEATKAIHKGRAPRKGANGHEVASRRKAGKKAAPAEKVS